MAYVDIIYITDSFKINNIISLLRSVCMEILVTAFEPFGDEKLILH